MTQNITRINVGARLSDIAIFNKVAYLAGQVPKNTVDQDLRAQTQEVLGMIDSLLEQAGSDKSRILTCQIFLKDVSKIAEMNAVWDAWIPKGNTPPRATIQAAMADPRWAVEIVVSAALRD